MSSYASVSLLVADGQISAKRPAPKPAQTPVIKLFDKEKMRQSMQRKSIHDSSTA